MNQQHSMRTLLSTGRHAISRSQIMQQHHSHGIIATTTTPQQRNVVFLPPSQNDEQARRRVLALYRTILKSLADVKLRFNVPGTVDHMRARVKIDFLRNRRPLRKDLVDAMVFRGYNELEEMQKHYQTRPHVIGYFAEYEPIYRALHAKNRPLSAVEAESKADVKKRALERMRATGQVIGDRVSAETTSAAQISETAKESDAASLLRRMMGGQEEQGNRA